MAGLSGGSGGSNAVRAGKAYFEISANDKKAMEALDRLKTRFKRVGATIAGVGAGIAGVGAAALAPLAGAIGTITEMGKLSAAADAFGLTAEQASRLFGIMQAAGSDIRDATEGIITFNSRISDAMNGTGEEAKKLFEGLGVSAEEFTGNSAENFYKLLDALRAVPDEAKRSALLLKAVGEDTGKNLLPVLAMSREEVAALGDAFQVSTADMAQAKAAAKSFAMITAQLAKAWREVVLALAPAITAILSVVVPIVQGIAAFAEKNRELVAIATVVAAGLVAVGLAITAVGLAVMAVAGIITAVTTVVAVFSAVCTPVGAIVAVVVVAVLALVAALVALAIIFRKEIITGFQALLVILESQFPQSFEAFRAAWDGIVAAVKKGDLETAFKIVGAAVRVAWFEMLQSITNGTTNWLAQMADRLGQFGIWVKAGAVVANAGLTFELSNQLAAAKKELGNLIKIAKAGGGDVVVPEVSGSLAPAYRRGFEVAAQRGAFNTQGMSTQMFGGSTFEKKVESAVNKIADNTKKGADEAAALNKNLKMK